MEKSARIFIAWMFVCLFFAGIVSAEAPVTISPGADDGDAAVISGCPCPTFSWSEIDDATDYRVAVFETGEPAAPVSYGDMPLLKTSALDQTIAEGGYAWTPSADRCLPGGRYTWYVAGKTMEDNLEWSEGRGFRVDALAGPGAGSEAALGDDAMRVYTASPSPGGDEPDALSLEQVISSTATRERLANSEADSQTSTENRGQTTRNSRHS